MKNKITLLNMVSGLVLQVCTIISGFVIPRIILINFGSGVNGLVTSLTQFLSYISLIEGGITGVVMANLYKPLIEKNENKVNSVVVASEKFFKQIGYIYIVYTIVLSILYPVLLHNEFGFFYTLSLTLILAVNGIIQYLFSATYRTLLSADKKVYIVSFTQSALVVANIILVYLSTIIYPSIHVLKGITAAVYLLQPVIFGRFTKKYYVIDRNVEPDAELLSKRWNGYAINFAAFIHQCTDVSILTIFSSLQMVSIYGVYALVTTGIKQLVMSITNGINPTLGQVYAKGDTDDLNNKLDLYEYIIFLLVFFLFTMTAILISSFVMIYTKGVEDAEYYQPLFGVLLVISEAIYLLKFPHLHLAYSADKFKEITPSAYIEALINIAVSIILVQKYGIIGVAIGTIAAMTYRMVYHVYYTNKLIPSRRQRIFYRKLLIFMIPTLICACFCVKVFPITNHNIINWLVHAAVYGIVIGIVILVISIIFFKNEIKFFMNYLKKH